jgi:hypothetical protein
MANPPGCKTGFSDEVLLQGACVMTAFLMGKSLTPKLKERLIFQGSRTRPEEPDMGSANHRKQEA